MAGVKQLTGSPWHVERYTREEGDKRRHNHRCKSFNKQTGFCNYYLERCRGSAHCSHYMECSENTEKATESPRTLDTQPKTSSQTQKQKESYLQEKNFLRGTIVYHKAHGRGKIIDLKDGIITVQFETAGIKRLSIAVCVKNGLLKRI